MATLYKRATPSQRRILRIVEGAVKNACDGHPDIRIPPDFRKSIAKRAAGTLTAQWPDVLAARSASSDSAALPIREPVRRAPCLSRKARGGAASIPTRRPLARLWKMLAMEVRPLKAAGHHERAEAYVEVLKMVAALQREATA